MLSSLIVITGATSGIGLAYAHEVSLITSMHECNLHVNIVVASGIMHAISTLWLVYPFSVYPVCTERNERGAYQ